MLLNVSSKSRKVEIINPSRNKPNTAKTKNTLLKSKIKKKKPLSEDSNYLGCDVFRLSKIAFLEGVFGFGGKTNVSI